MRMKLGLLMLGISAIAIGMDEAELVTRGFGLVPQILQRVDVLKKQISSSDAVFGKLTLNTVGTYSPLTNLVADIVITGTNVTLDLAGRSLVGSVTISGSAIVVKNGAITPRAPFNRDNTEAAITVHQNATNVLIKRCHVQCTDSILTGSIFEIVLTDTTNIVYEQIITGSVFESMPGRSGIEVSGNVVSVFDCSIVPGASASTSTINAEAGGHGVLLSGNANKVRVLDCIMISGDGGDAASGEGGDAGNGIYVKDTVNHAEISRCTLFGTGAGGDGSSAGGDGGHGVRIESTTDDIGVHDCRIRNTGVAGSPSGTAGKAVLDEVTTAGKYSMVFSNFAHNIANAVKFDLRGTGTEGGISTPNPPDGTVLNPFANVYVP